MKPTVGRIVHVGDSDSDHPIAAIITRVHDDGSHVSLTCFPAGQSPGYMTVRYNDGERAVETDTIPYAEKLTNGCWSWPPRGES